MDSGESTQLRVSCSIMNFFDRSTFYTMLWTLSKFVDFAKRAGYSDLQWHPLRAIPCGVQMGGGWLRKEEKNWITSAHQSWRVETSLQQILAHPVPSIAAVSFVILPERVKSLDALEKLQKCLGRKIPVVLSFPEDPGQETGTKRPFAEKIFQPAPEVLKSWGVKPTDLEAEAARRGYGGFALDLFHFRRSGPFNLNPWQESLPLLLPYSSEIHVSAGRLDKAYEPIDSMSELEDLILGTDQTELTAILREIRLLGWKGRVVIEVPAGALFTLHRKEGKTSQFLSPVELATYHLRIIDTTTNLLS